MSTQTASFMYMYVNFVHGVSAYHVNNKGTISVVDRHHGSKDPRTGWVC